MSNEMEGNQEEHNFGGELQHQEEIPGFSAVIHSNQDREHAAPTTLPSKFEFGTEFQ